MCEGERRAWGEGCQSKAAIERVSSEGLVHCAVLEFSTLPGMTVRDAATCSLVGVGTRRKQK